MINKSFLTMTLGISTILPGWGMVMDEEYEPTPPSQRYIQPRIVQAETKIPAATIPDALAQLCDDVATMNEAAFASLVAEYPKHSDWPKSVVLRALNIAAGAGYVPAQAELCKLHLAESDELFGYWLSVIRKSGNKEILNSLLNYIEEKQSYSYAIHILNAEIEALEDGTTPLNSISLTNNTFSRDNYPNCKPVEISVEYFTSNADKISPDLAQQTPPTPEPKKPSNDMSDILSLRAQLANQQYSNAYAKLCRDRLVMLLGLISEGADINDAPPITKGSKAIHYACSLGNVEILRWLLQNGADPNAKTGKGASPMTCVGSTNRKAVIKLLQEYGGS